MLNVDLWILRTDRCMSYSTEYSFKMCNIHKEQQLYEIHVWVVLPFWSPWTFKSRSCPVAGRFERRKGISMVLFQHPGTTLRFIIEIGKTEWDTKLSKWIKQNDILYTVSFLYIQILQMATPYLAFTCFLNLVLNPPSLSA